MRLTWRRTTPPAPPAAAAAPRAPKPPPAPDFSDLENQARYHRDRLALYRARMHGSHATSLSRLEELEHASSAADERLRTARRLAKG